MSRVRHSKLKRPKVPYITSDMEVTVFVDKRAAIVADFLNEYVEGRVHKAVVNPHGKGWVIEVSQAR